MYFPGTQLTGNILLGVSLWWTSTPSRGSSNTPRHRMLHAKETGISSSWLDLWPLCTITLLLNILNVILNLQISITKSPVGSVKSTVWRLSTVCSLQVEFCRLWGLQSEVCRLRSAAWGLQPEVYSLRSAVWGLKVEFCSKWGLSSAACSLQTDICSVRSASRVLQSKFYIVYSFWSRSAV